MGDFIALKNARVCTILYMGKEYNIIVNIEKGDTVNSILQEWSLEKWGVKLNLKKSLIYNKSLKETASDIEKGLINKPYAIKNKKIGNDEGIEISKKFIN